MAGKEWGREAGKDETRENCDGKHIAPYALAVGGLGGAEDDALDLVVQTAACLESVRLRIAGEVVEVGLEQPEGL